MHKGTAKIADMRLGKGSTHPEHTSLTAAAQEWTYALVLLWLCFLGSLGWLKISGDIMPGPEGC